MWWKERSDSSKLTSDLYTHTMECTYINKINHFFLVESMCELMKSQSKRAIQLINEITGYFLSPWGRKYSGFSNSVKAYED